MFDIVKLLIKEGAAISSSTLRTAIETNNNELTYYLFKNVKKNSIIFNSAIFALRNKNKEAIELMIQEGMKINSILVTDHDFKDNQEIIYNTIIL